MPELYAEANCKYQKMAQPFLDSVARGIRDDRAARNFLLLRTEAERDFHDSVPVWREQKALRDPGDQMSGPFWSNYWSEPCPGCNCLIDQSVSMEIDALFFLKNSAGKVLAIHVEMKRDYEQLSLGQAQAYRPRALCYRNQGRPRSKVIEHDEFITVLFCGEGTDLSEVSNHFDRVIPHSEARKTFPGYPG